MEGQTEPTALYVVMVSDRHTDPEPHLFATEEAALAYARQAADGWLVELLGGHDGWLYYAEHPTESDSIWVIERTIEG
jgi:hypothetical protein